PTGIIAAGTVVPAPKDEQLRNIGRQYESLSAAYVNHVGNTFYVCLKLDSVVDFDSPLEQNTLRQLPQFQEVNFHFQGGGKQFAPDHPVAVKALADEWRNHSLVQQGQGRGRRLIDVFLERGGKASDENDLELAVSYYQQALDIDPNHSIAQEKLNDVKDRIAKRVIITPPPSSPPKKTHKAELEHIRDRLDEPNFLEPLATEEAQKRVLVEIARRQGQTKFRQTLLNAYGYKCAITGFDAGEALEAAHIIPYAKTENNDPTNGLLLRADLHTLFDLNLLAIHPDTLQVVLHPDLQNTEYRTINGKQIRIPDVETFRPNLQALRQKLQQCTWLDVG
ncbi:MAG: HNH endonuclease, partial [Nodosilinea sp.]